MGYNPQAIPELVTASRFPALEVRLQEIQNVRREALASHEMARNRMADRITRSFTPFRLGDKVWLEAKNLNVGGTYRKLRSLREGPFEIEEVKGPLTYKLRLPIGWKIHPVFHASLLSAYKETETHGPGFVRPPPDIMEGEEEWEVESIVRHRKYRGNTIRYLVKWKGYPSADNSWKPEENLEHAEEVLTAYKTTHSLL